MSGGEKDMIRQVWRPKNCRELGCSDRLDLYFLRFVVDKDYIA